MNKKIVILFVLAVILCVSCENTTSEKKDTTITVNFSGPAVSPAAVYTCWIENESGVNIQNLYVCNSVVGINKSLTGDALPYWKTVKYKENKNIDGITGASVQSSKTMINSLKIGAATRIKVCFEIDRSLNSNTIFGDRPSFIYKSEEIDLTNLSSDYTLSLIGWMANGTNSGKYSQAPNVTIPGYSEYTLMTDLSYIEALDDMVTALTATVE